MRLEEKAYLILGGALLGITIVPGVSVLLELGCEIGYPIGT